MTAAQVGAGVIAGRRRLAPLLALAVLVLPASSPAAPGWGAPRNLSLRGHDASSPQVALNAAGTAVAVWRQRVSRRAGRTEIVEAAVRAPGGTWGPPRDISVSGDVDPDGSQPLNVALDPVGNAVAVWSQRTGGSNSVVAAVLPAGGDWSPPRQISTPGLMAGGPRVALDSAGNAVAVWYEHPYAVEPRVVAAVRPSGGTWSAPQSISPDGEPAVDPHVALDRAGTAFAVWIAIRNCVSGICRYAVQASVRPAGGIWSAPQDLSSDSYYEMSAPQVQVDEAGHALAVWSRDAGYASEVIESVDRPAGGQWSSRVIFGHTTYDTPAVPLAVNSAGDAAAAWSTGPFRGSDSGAVVASTRQAGGTWEPPVVLSPSRWNSRAAVAVDTAGAAVVIWERYDIVWIAEHPAGGTWGKPRRVSSRGRYTSEPEIALGAAGRGVLVWHQFDGSNEIVQAVARPEPPPCAVPHVVGKTLARAKAAIAASHCRTGRIARISSKGRKGQVLSQSPTAGQFLTGGTRMNLTVSRGRRR